MVKIATIVGKLTGLYLFCTDDTLQLQFLTGCQRTGLFNEHDSPITTRVIRHYSSVYSMQ